MERLIQIGEIKVNTTLPHEDCVNCSAVRGELDVFVATIKEKSPLESNTKALIECHAVSVGKRAKRNGRHMDITIESDGEKREASRLVRNWAQRIVHCDIR